MTVGFREKVQNWGSSDGPLGRGGNQFERDYSPEEPGDDQRGGADEDTEDDSSEEADNEGVGDADADDEDIDMVFTLEETEGYDYDFSDDAEPEGDDPDELRSPAMEQALSMNDGTGSRSSDSGKWMFTPPRDTGKEDFQREHHKRTRHQDIDPEDGGPAETQNIARIEGLQAAQARFAGIATGSVASPPDGGQGSGNPTPPRPEFTQSSSAGDTSSTQTFMADSGYAASPPDGGQGTDGHIIPPRPEFSESFEN